MSLYSLQHVPFIENHADIVRKFQSRLHICLKIMYRGLRFKALRTANLRPGRW